MKLQFFWTLATWRVICVYVAASRIAWEAFSDRVPSSEAEHLFVLYA